MYAFRKPFAAAHFSGETVSIFDLKSALIISQLCGYALSKFLGVKFNSEMKPSRRAWALVLLIVWAELALVLFAVLPPGGKVFALFLNGLPLGTIWGVVFSFLEGRRTSEILGAGLSCAYVVASGAVKSIGSSLIGAGVTEAWMPALTGALFLPIFLAAVYGLSLVPRPSAANVEARTEREPMSKAERRQFLRRFLLGLLLLVIVYLFLTSYRDFRDNYAAEIWADLGADQQSSLFTLTEIPIAISVMIALGLLFLVKNNRRGLLLTYAIMIAGSALIGVATLLFDVGGDQPADLDDPGRPGALPRLRALRLRPVRSHDRGARHRGNRGLPDLCQRRRRLLGLGRDRALQDARPGADLQAPVLSLLLLCDQHRVLDLLLDQLPLLPPPGQALAGPSQKRDRFRRRFAT